MEPLLRSTVGDAALRGDDLPHPGRGAGRHLLDLVDDLWQHPTWATITSQPWRNDVANSDVLELVVTVLFLVLALVGLKVLPFYLTAWVLPGLLIPLLQPSEVHALMSMPRFVLVLFPLFIVLGKLIQPAVIRIPWYIVSVTLLVLLTAQFALWYWVS